MPFTQVDQRKHGFTVCIGPCLRQGKKLEQTEFFSSASSTAPAFFRYRIQPEREFVDSELLSSLLRLYGLLVLTFNIVISGHISALHPGRQPQSRKCTTAGYLASGVMN